LTLANAGSRTVAGDRGSYFYPGKTGHHPNQGTDYRGKYHHSGMRAYEYLTELLQKEFRNKRDVWTVATAGFSGNHFSVVLPALTNP
ncbi:MAG: hypothetical protein M1318_05075, partial [Firmicutes bacterium]|nr:hypothetical protein [Bacillota bacterium]